MELMPHLKLPDNLGIRYAILPGDPARVDRITEQLEDVEELAYNREYKSIAGTYKGVRVLAVSTGIGGPSTGICNPHRKLRSLTEGDPPRRSCACPGSCAR